MTQGTVSRSGVITLGLALGKDDRMTTITAFYRAVSELFKDKTGKDLAAACDDLSAAGVAKKLKITQDEVKTLPESVRRNAFKTGTTIARFVGLARRFPDADPNVSLEVYATAAAHETRLAKTLSPDKDPDKKAVDKDAVALVTAAIAESDDGTVSITAAREAWQESGGGKRAGKSTDKPQTVGERVDWLTNQETAIRAYAADTAAGYDALVNLTIMLQTILSETDRAAETATESK